MAGRRQPEENALQTFPMPKKLIDDLEAFRAAHPETGSINDLVIEALKEFLYLHSKDKSWLKQAPLD